MAVSHLIRGCPIFKELYDEEIERIVSHCSVSQFENGETIALEGEEGRELFLLLSGKADVFKSLADGKWLKIASLKRGDAFGEAVLLEEQTRSASVIANGKCDVLAVNVDDVFALFEKDPKIFSILILNIARVLAQRLRASSNAISSIRNRFAKKSA